MQTYACTERQVKSVDFPQICQSIITTILAFTQETFDWSSRYDPYQDSITGIIQAPAASCKVKSWHC